MRLISLHRCTNGMILARPILSEGGSVLLERGVSLTSKMIRRLGKLGVERVYIEDKYTEDIIIEDTISEETRKAALKAIRETFTQISHQGKWKQSVARVEVVQSFRSVLNRLIEDIQRNKQVISMLSNAVSYDQYLFHHSINVAVYSIALGIKNGYNQSQLIDLGMGAILHDIGKLLIPTDILNKPGKLSPDEFEVVKKHTDYGFHHLRKLSEISLLAAHCAYQHHERMDGSGYPRGLKGNEIHPYARIIAVTDVFDALTCHRVYRKAWLPHVASELIVSGSGSLFEIEVVKNFKHSVAIYPLGLTVTLSTGETGVVVDHNRFMPERPIVRIVKDKKGTVLTHFEEVDLSKNHSILITDCDAIL